MKIFILYVLFFNTVAVFGQKTQIGFRAGLNFSTIKTPEQPNPYQLNPGFNGGVLINVPMNKGFAVQPEVLYSTQGTAFKDGEGKKINFGYLNVPVLFQFIVGKGFRFETGPQPGIMLSAKSKYGSSAGDIGYRFKDLDIAWVAGAEYLIDKSVGVYARYNLGLKNINTLNNGEIKNRVIQVGFFVLFK